MSHSPTSSRSLISRSVTISPGLLLCSHHYNYSCCGALSLECRDFVMQQEGGRSCKGLFSTQVLQRMQPADIQYDSCRDTKREGWMVEEEGAAWMLLCDFKLHKSSEHDKIKLDMIYCCIAGYGMNGTFKHGRIKVRQTLELMSDMKVSLNLGMPGSKKNASTALSRQSVTEPLSFVFMCLNTVSYCLALFTCGRTLPPL